MGAMKNWAMIVQELHDARDHWQTCNHDCQQAIRNELEAHMRLERAMAEHQREVKAFIASQDAYETLKDAPGTPPACDCEETCAECGKPVTEDEYADTPRGEPVLHDACRPLYAAWRREQEAEWRADDVMFGEGRGTL